MRALHAAATASAFLLLSTPAFSQTPTPPARTAPVSVELSACKSTALLALQERDASIKDIYFDEDV